MPDDLKRLYNEKGEEASIYDVIEWFNCYYPEDVFIYHDIAKARNILNRMLVNSKITRIAVFGTTKEYTIDERIKFREYMDTVKKPILIITSTCKGWDEFGRTYADLNPGVEKKVIKARIKELGYKKGVETCNEEIVSMVDFGVTGKNPKTKGTNHMIETLKKMGKKIVYIGES